MISTVTNSLAPSSGSDHGAGSISASAQCWLDSKIPSLLLLAPAPLAFLAWL